MLSAIKGRGEGEGDMSGQTDGEGTVSDVPAQSQLSQMASV